MENERTKSGRSFWVRLLVIQLPGNFPYERVRKRCVGNVPVKKLDLVCQESNNPGDSCTMLRKLLRGSHQLLLHYSEYVARWFFVTYSK